MSRPAQRNSRKVLRVFRSVTILDQIHEEIDALSERRGQLWRVLGEGRDDAAADELKQIDERLARLWDEHRALRARVRFGERDRIIARARAEERLERAA
jgi:hypothetical protein